MTIRMAQQQLQAQLGKLYDPREAAAITGWVLDHITGVQKIDRLLIADQPLLPEKQFELNRITTELLDHRPIQYVLGEAWFYGLRFSVNETVLIPRPETEELVQWILASIPSTEKKYTVLDIGTGSGCIPVALKHEKPSLQVTAIDISEGALVTARQNATTLGTDINWQLLDFLDASAREHLQTFDIIVSNPPYVRQSERAEMAKHVAEHEPSLALFVPDNDALLFYRAIAQFGKTHLENEGMIFLEINEALGTAVVELLAANGYTCELRKDLQGRDRMIKAFRNNP